MKPFLFIAILFISFACFAQKQTITYIKVNGQKTSSKDSALIIRTVTEESSSLYDFKENFVTGEPFRTGKTSKANEILPEDTCIVYYPSGKKLSAIFYNNGLEQAGTFYFANGTIFKVSQFSHSTPDPARPAVHATQELITTCNDSDGKALITNGNGHFIGYKPVIDKKFMTNATAYSYNNWLYNDNEEGKMKNGVKDDVWTGKESRGDYTEVYKEGKLIAGELIDKDGKHYNYESSIEKQATFPGGIQAFYQFLASTIKYPKSTGAKHLKGRVIASFVVDKDGSLTDIRIFQSPGDDLTDETVRVLKLSPLWSPGNQRGVLVRQIFTVPVNFN